MLQLCQLLINIFHIQVQTFLFLLTFQKKTKKKTHDCIIGKLKQKECYCSFQSQLILYTLCKMLTTSSSDVPILPAKPVVFLETQTIALEELFARTLEGVFTQ